MTRWHDHVALRKLQWSFVHLFTSSTPGRLIYVRHHRPLLPPLFSAVFRWHWRSLTWLASFRSELVRLLRWHSHFFPATISEDSLRTIPFLGDLVLDNTRLYCNYVVNNGRSTAGWLLSAGSLRLSPYGIIRVFSMLNIVRLYNCNTYIRIWHIALCTDHAYLYARTKRVRQIYCKWSKQQSHAYNDT